MCTYFCSKEWQSLFAFDLTEIERNLYVKSNCTQKITKHGTENEKKSYRSDHHTCNVVLRVSMGVIRILHSPADIDAAPVFAAIGMSYG